MFNRYCQPLGQMCCIFYLVFLGLSSAASIDGIGALRGSKVIKLKPGVVKSFTSPNYPKNYGKKDSETWEYTCKDTKANVELNCKYFYTQSKSDCKKADYIKVVDGTKALLGIKCGKLDPFESIVSSDNSMKIQFKTNGDKTTKKGFSCNVKCIILTTTTSTTTSTTTPKPTTTTTTTTTTPIPTTTTTPKPTTTTATPSPTTTPVPPLECGIHEISPGTNYPIQSPKYPKKYFKNSKCTWELTCSATASTIELTCDFFETQTEKKCSKSDYVKVSDGSSVLGNICGKQSPFKALVSTDNFMKIQFKTNGDKTVKKGFSCSAKCSAITTTTQVSTTTTPITTTTTTAKPTTTTPIPTTTTTLVPTTTTTPIPSTTTLIPSTSTEGITTTEDPAVLPRLPCQCGVATKPETSNVHDLSNHPWTVAILDNSDKHFCSGTIINTYYILTSTSCVSGKGTSFKIRLNEHELGTGLPRAITRYPTSVVTNGDLTLIKMDTTVSLTAYDSVKPACLPNGNKDFIGDSATHSGYDHGKCMKNDGSWTSESGNKLTFTPGPGAHAYCREDLGGPIVSEEGGKHFLAGIALDESCSTTAQTSAKVSDYHQWIMDNSNSGRFCQR